MLSRRRLAPLFLALLFLALTATFVLPGRLVTAARAEAPTRFRHGISIHNWMNWADPSDATRTRYAWPPYASAGHALPDEELLIIRRAGFGFVRLTLDPGPFLQFEGSRRDQLDGMLLDNAKRVLAAGLDLIVDFHPNTQVAAYAPRKLVESPQAPLFLAYLAMVQRTARVLQALPPERIAIEPINEPETGYGGTVGQWQDMLAQLHAGIRGQAPRNPIILTGGQSGSIEGLQALDPRRDPDANLFYSFHYYLPYAFTHQGTEPSGPDAPPFKYLSGMPYPADPSMGDALWARISARITADPSIAGRDTSALLGRTRRAVAAYLDARPGPARIAADFDGIASWAQRHGIPAQRIILGEFGVTRTYGRYHGAEDADRARWLGDVRNAAERRGFAWSLWLYKGYGGMATVRTDTSAEFDPVTLSALGLEKR